MVHASVATKMPKIGMRIFKSALAVLLCFLFYYAFRKEGIIFYSQLAALWCIQPQRENTKSKAIQRTFGTLTGAFYGLIVLLINQNLIPPTAAGRYWYAGVTSLMIIIVIYTTILFKKKDASYFSCVVFLSIVVIHIGDADPFLFVFNRVIDTMLGIAIGMLVNQAHLPRRREKDILFVSGMDDTLLAGKKQMNAYSLVELNRMLADGAQFTVSTRRTPASLIEPLKDIKLKLPVIAMDGAVMYDISKHEYLHVYVISKEITEAICSYLDRFQVNYFINMLLDNTLMIQYKELKHETEKTIYDMLHTSPFRNYTNMDIHEMCATVYIMLIQKTEFAKQIFEGLQSCEWASHLRMICYPSDDFPGYSYIKIYNHNATRDNMIDYLKKETGLKKTVTFGSIEGKYDVVIHEYDHTKVVKTLKKMYEPFKWSFTKY